MTNRKIGLRRDLKILELGFEERYFTADDALKYAFPAEISPEHNIHHRHLRTLVKMGFLSTFSSPALPPGKKLYAITRQGVVFLSQHIAVPVEGLTLVRGGIMATTINHHLAILRVRHALSRLPQVSWIPNRFVQRRFSKMKVEKIPDALAYVSLPSSHEYWGNLGVIAVEVELSWKDHARQVNDIARLYATSGEEFSNCFIVGGNKSIVKSLRHALDGVCGKEVRLSKDDVIEIPKWFREACSFCELNDMESLTLDDLGDLPYISATSGTYGSRFQAPWRQALTDIFQKSDAFYK